MFLRIKRQHSKNYEACFTKYAITSVIVRENKVYLDIIGFEDSLGFEFPCFEMANSACNNIIDNLSTKNVIMHIPEKETFKCKNEECSWYLNCKYGMNINPTAISAQMFSPNAGMLSVTPNLYEGYLSGSRSNPPKVNVM